MNVGRKETIKKYLRKKDCYCPDCGKLLSHQNSKRCQSCAGIERIKKHPNTSFKSGQNHPNWKGGIVSLRKKLRSLYKYKRWRESVFARDDYTCQECGVRGGYLEAHHIKSFSDYPALRFKTSNGITYCKECHGIIDERRYV